MAVQKVGTVPVHTAQQFYFTGRSRFPGRHTPQKANAVAFFIKRPPLTLLFHAKLVDVGRSNST